MSCNVWTSRITTYSFWLAPQSEYYWAWHPGWICWCLYERYVILLHNICRIFNLMHCLTFQHCQPFFLVSPMISIMPGPIPRMDLLMLIWLVCILPHHDIIINYHVPLDTLFFHPRLNPIQFGRPSGHHTSPSDALASDVADATWMEWEWAMIDQIICLISGDIEDPSFVLLIADEITQFTSYGQWLLHSDTAHRTTNEGYNKTLLHWEHLASGQHAHLVASTTDPSWNLHWVLHDIASSAHSPANTDVLHPLQFLAAEGAEADLCAGLESLMPLFYILWTREHHLTSAVHGLNKKTRNGSTPPPISNSIKIISAENMVCNFL